MNDDFDDLILGLVINDPQITLKALIEKSGRKRRAVDNAIGRLIERGKITDREFTNLDSPQFHHTEAPLAIVFIKTPPTNEARLFVEAKLNEASDVGKWKFIASSDDSEYDYVLFLSVDNSDPNLVNFYRGIRQHDGVVTRTLWCLDAGENS